MIEHDGGMLLGKSENEPAKWEWFVPGRMLFRNESRTDAVHRVAEAELGEPIVIDKCLNTYENVYETTPTDGVDSKHYVATGYHYYLEKDDPAITEND